MPQYLELEVVILFAAVIVTLGAIIIYKDRKSNRKQESNSLDAYELKKLNRHLSRKTMTPAQREKMARRRMMRQRMAR